MTPAFYPVFQAKKELWEKEEQKKAQSSLLSLPVTNHTL